MLSLASTKCQANYLLSVILVNMIMNLSRMFQGRNKQRKIIMNLIV